MLALDWLNRASTSAERLTLRAEVRGSAPAPAVPLLVYGEACRLGQERLRLANVTFKHIPYDVRAR